MGSGFRRLMVAAASAAAIEAHAIASQWTTFDLTPEGMGMATAVSPAGVVVGCRNVGSTETRAFAYESGSRRDLPAPASAASCATAVNDNGMIAGRINGEITIWQNGAPRRLGVGGNVTAVSDEGVVVGGMEDGTSNANGGRNTRAFMWSNGIFTDLGAPPGWTYAIGINRRGQVAVFANGKLLMYENGTLRDLGVAVTNAYGFNDRGEIAGMSGFGHGPEPFIWDGAVREIAGAYSYAGAVALNNAGQVLASGEGVYGFLVEGGQAARTDSLLGAPWTHTEPKALNDRGWIVGQGGNANDFHAFLAIPKETSAPGAAGNPATRSSPRSMPLIRARAP